MTSPADTNATESVLSTLLTGYAESQHHQSNAERAETFATFFINHLQENN